MFALLARSLPDALMRRSEFPDHLKEHSDRHTPRSRRPQYDHSTRRAERYGRDLW